MDLLGSPERPAERREPALERLKAIVAHYQSADAAVRQEALGRAMVLCGQEWGGYGRGLLALAEYLDRRADDDPAAALLALRLREEADDPGSLLRAAEAREARAGGQDRRRQAVVARYGSEQAALGPTPLERRFVEAAVALAADAADPWSALAGWDLPWHPLPEAVAQAVSGACPLPETIAAARAECLRWQERLAELEVLADGSGTAMLPTACAARKLVVENLWARALPARSWDDLRLRLDYWAGRDGDHGGGYALLCREWDALCHAALPMVEGSREKCRRLRAENPGRSLADIGRELGISRQAVHKHLKS